MKKALTKGENSADTLGEELLRAVRDFAATATPAEVRALLKQARSEAFDQVETKRVAVSEPDEN